MAKIVVVKVVNGSVQCYDANGSYVRTLTSGAISAVANGDIVSVTKSNGTVELYDANTGNYKRTL